MGIRKLIRQAVAGNTGLAGNTGRAAGDPEIRARIDVPTRTLSPVSLSTVNSLRSSRSEAAISTANTSSRTSAENHENAAKVSMLESVETTDKVSTDKVSTDPHANMNSPRQSDARPPLQPHVNRNDMVSPSPATSKLSDTDLQFSISKANGTMSGVTNTDKAKMASPPEKGSLLRAVPSSEEPNTTSSRSATNGFSIAEDDTTVTNNTEAEHPPNARATSPQQPQWSSAIGKANLGKSGRVIEKLMAENDALKRELKVEKLKSDEAKQAIKLAETRLQQKMSEVETELNEVSIIKAQLKRSDRKLADMKAAVEGERQRAITANEAARAQQDRADAVIREAQDKIDHANNLRMLVEGSYAAFSGHYKDEEARAMRIVQKQQKEIDQIITHKREDAKRIATLQDLIATQDKYIEQITRDKQALDDQHERYKAEQAAGLVGIKTEAMQRMEEQEAWREEADRTIGRLRWALNIQEQRNTGAIP